jgi:CheY-like chemotaxis protein
MDEKNTFFTDLRAALNHLYDPEYLEKSPFISWMGLSDRFDSASLLQQSLIDAIEEIRPKPGSLQKLRSQLAYDLLLYRYVQKLTQEEISHQFGISERQLRREQNKAIALLATIILKRTEQGDKLPPQSEKMPSPPISVNEEAITFPWLNPAEPANPTDPQQALSLIQEVITPLAERLSVQLAIQQEPGIPLITMHALAFRQMMLSLLDQMIQACPSGEVTLRAHQQENQAKMVLEGMPAPSRSITRLFDLNLVKKLTEHYKVRLEPQLSQRRVAFSLGLPLVEQTTVLLIDDNRDILQLFQRYTEGSPYQIVPVSDPAGVFSQIEAVNPNIIILDVMMPALDGWEVLLRIRKNPLSARTPVVICSILNQEELAYSLGANGYLHKPVRQADLLGMLDQQAGYAEKE